MERPTIGVLPLWNAKEGKLWMRPNYFDALIRSGALPVLLPLTEDASVLRRAVEVCGGLLFPGGPDVEPARYGETARFDAVSCSPERDRAEMAALDLALEEDVPVFAICRGIQVLNVRLGGTLWQDLPAERGVEHFQPQPYDVPFHGVTAAPGTPLAALLGTEEIRVNSCHHQGVRALAPGLLAEAVSGDGLVEAVCMPGRRFVRGVQWHPERTFETDGRSRALFADFVRACASAPRGVK